MENENEKNNDETTNSTETNTGADQAKETEKVFKQTDVDRIVKERLDREKQSSKKIKEDADSMVNSLNETISKYETILKNVIEKEKSGIPEQFKGLLDKLSILEQFEFLSDPKNKVEKKTVPETPKSEGTIENNKTQTYKSKFM